MTKLAINIGDTLIPFKGTPRELYATEKMLKGKLCKDFCLSKDLEIEAVNTEKRRVEKSHKEKGKKR